MELEGLDRGARVDCPGCGNASVVKVSNKMDGWTCVGKVFVCALCGHEFGPVGPRPGGTVADAGGEKSRASLALFGENVVDTEDRSALLDEPKANFCKDCQHFFRHPFRTGCVLHERDVKPMDDCADFRRRAREDDGKHDDDGTGER